MKLDGFDLLKVLVRNREVRLGELKRHVKKRFGDHRDWYPVASLYDAGLISSDLRDGGTFRRGDVKQIAITLHTMTFGPGEFTYRGIKLTNGGDFNELVIVFPTFQADLYFAEQRQKRTERVFAFIVAIVAAVATALATSLIG